MAAINKPEKQVEELTGNLELEKHKRAAINKLEKQVEELTGNLELEKRKRADFEASMNQENANLKSDLNDIQLQCKQTKELLSSEIEKLKNLHKQERQSKNKCRSFWKLVGKCICIWNAMNG
ncbi:myosin-14-like [Eucalyptus grandis]|uniref:myosin-14-like n=1 Tax=Eucalyptus grandis TaxID=71139 RepID=UPI00192EC9A5|nr:myosin-14-like [Eucalyptus grandis]